MLKKFTSVEKGALGFFSMVPGIVLIIITSAVLRQHYDEIVEADEVSASPYYVDIVVKFLNSAVTNTHC